MKKIIYLFLSMISAFPRYGKVRKRPALLISLTNALLLWLTLGVGAWASSAPSASSADHLYAQKDYVGAADAYEKMLADTTTMQANAQLRANVCYNLGNCYYKTHNYALAVLNYQRALRIDPSDKDASFNLELTQSKLQDQFTPPSEMFFVTWSRMLVRSMSATAWGYWAVFFMVLAVVCWLLFKGLGSILGKKICFSLACISGVLCLFGFLLAYAENNWSYADKQVVVTSMTKTFDSPTPWAKAVKELHEGTLLDVIDEQQGGWMMVEMPDGVSAWVKHTAVEQVD